jgi:hypothetical protein
VSMTGKLGAAVQALKAGQAGRLPPFSSASEKNRRCRSRARIQRCTTWTATSTLASHGGLPVKGG